MGGAPRSQNNGQVLMFKQGKELLSITPDHYLSGEQFGSGFGYAVEIMDLNNDR